MRANDATTLAAFDAFFAQPDLECVESSCEVVELATAIRVRHALRTPDALQAANHLQMGPEHLMLTGNAAFRSVQLRFPGGRTFLIEALEAGKERAYDLHAVDLLIVLQVFGQQVPATLVLSRGHD